MEIQKAIELLKLEYAQRRWDRQPDQKTAILMAIDGLERIEAYREQRIHIALMPLKGELLS